MLTLIIVRKHLDPGVCSWVSTTTSQAASWVQPTSSCRSTFALGRIRERWTPLLCSCHSHQRALPLRLVRNESPSSPAEASWITWYLSKHAFFQAQGSCFPKISTGPVHSSSSQLPWLLSQGILCCAYVNLYAHFIINSEDLQTRLHSLILSLTFDVTHNVHLDIL